jgi:hypothetical protein
MYMINGNSWRSVASGDRAFEIIPINSDNEEVELI